MTNEIPADQAPKPGIRVLAQYTKALSFVSKEGSQVEGLPGTPSIELGVDLSSEPVKNQTQVFECVLKLMARAHLDNETVFEIDIAYAGVFDISNAPPEYLEPILMIDCPQLLFPFARRVITDTTREGGFPPLLVDPIDFAGLYQNQLNQASSG